MVWMVTASIRWWSRTGTSDALNKTNRYITINVETKYPMPEKPSISMVRIKNENGFNQFLTGNGPRQWFRWFLIPFADGSEMVLFLLRFPSVLLDYLKQTE